MSRPDPPVAPRRCAKWLASAPEPSTSRSCFHRAKGAHLGLSRSPPLEKSRLSRDGGTAGCARVICGGRPVRALSGGGPYHSSPRRALPRIPPSPETPAHCHGPSVQPQSLNASRRDPTRTIPKHRQHIPLLAAEEAPRSSHLHPRVTPRRSSLPLSDDGILLQEGEPRAVLALEAAVDAPLAARFALVACSVDNLSNDFTFVLPNDVE